MPTLPALDCLKSRRRGEEMSIEQQHWKKKNQKTKILLFQDILFHRVPQSLDGCCFIVLFKADGCCSSALPATRRPPDPRSAENCSGCPV